MTGGVASTSGDLLTDNPQLTQLLEKIGGAGALTDILLSTMGAIAGLIAAGYSISAALRMSTEESSDRVGPVLATSVLPPPAALRSDRFVRKPVHPLEVLTVVQQLLAADVASDLVRA